ncbi:titin homolog isoform X2 [Lucilia sericata]|uniref:titin homolog isoform X2 n=1 Tax=Lucilia sericata TaxID=13632 RepID=UPI0018A80F1C|nr:titin homolog isoform X2 [Lucilia sericata]
MLPQFSELPEFVDKSDKPKSPVDSKTSSAKPADDSEDEIEIEKPTAIDSKPSMLPQYSEFPESLDKSDKPKSPVYSKTSPAKPADDFEDEFEIKKPTAIDSKPSKLPQFSELPESLDKSDKPKPPVDSKTSPAKPADDSEDEFEIRKPTAIESKPSMPPQFSDFPKSLDKSDKPKSPVDSKTSPIKPISVDDTKDEIELKKPTAIDSKPSKPPQYSELPESLDKSDKPKSPVDSKTSPEKPADDSEDEIEIEKPTAIDSKPSMLPQFSELPESLDKSDKPKSPVDSKTSPAKPADDSEDEFEIKKPTAIDSKPSMLPQFSELPESLDKSDKSKSPVYSKTSPAKPADDSEDEFEIKKPTAIDSKPSKLPQFSELPESLDKSDKPKSPVDSKTSPAKPADDSEDEFEIKKPTAIDSKPSMPPQFSDLPKSLDKSDKPKSPVKSKMSPIKLTSFDDSKDEIESEDVFELRQPAAIDAKPSMLPQFSELAESLDKSDKAKSPVDSKTSFIKLTSADDSEDEFELKKPTATDSMHSMLPQFSELQESLDKSDKPKSPVDLKTSSIKPISVDDTKDEIELKKPTAIDSKPSIPPQYSDLTESLDKSDKPKFHVDSKTSPAKPAGDSEDEFEIMKPTAIDSKPSMLPQFSELPESLDKSDKPKSPVDSKTSPIKPISVDDTKDEIELKKPTAIDSKLSIPPQYSDLPESLDKSDKPKSPVDSKTSPADDSEDEIEIEKPTAIDSKPSMLPQFSKLPESLDKSDKPISHVDSKTSPAKPAGDSEDEFEIMKPTAIDSKPSMLPQFSELPESLDKSDKPKSPVDSKTSPIKPISVDDSEDNFDQKKPTAIDSKLSIPPQYSDLPEYLDKSDKPKSPVDSKISAVKPTSADDSEDKFDQKKPTAIHSKPSMLPQFSELPESLDRSDKPKSPVDSKTSSAKPADDSEDEIEIEKPTAIDSKPSMLPQFSELPESLDKSDKPKSPVDSKTSPIKPISVDDTKDEIELKKPTAIDSKPSIPPQYSDLPESLDKSDKLKSPVDSKTSPNKLTSVDDTKDEIELKKPTVSDSKPLMPPQFSDLPESLDKSDKPKSPVDSKPTSADDSEDKFDQKKPTAIDSKPSMLPQFSELPEFLDKSDKPKSPVDSKTSPIKPISVDDTKDEIELKKPTAIDSKPAIPPQYSDLPESLDKSDEPKSPVDSKTSPNKLTSVDDTKDEIELKKPTVSDSKPLMPTQFSDLPESLDKSDKPKSPVDSKISPIKPISADDSEDKLDQKKPTAIDSKPSMLPQFSELPQSLDKSDEPKSPVDSETSPNKLTSVDDTKDEIELKKPTVSDSKPLMLPQFSDLPESLDKSDKPKSPVDSKISPIKPTSADDSEDKFDQKKPTAIDSKPSMLPQFSEFPESLDKSDKPKSPVDSKTSSAKPADDSEDEIEIEKPTAIDSKPSMLPQFSELPESLDKSDKPKSPVDSKISPAKPADDSEDEIEIEKPTAIDSKSSMPPQHSELPESLDKSDKPKSPVDSKTSPAKPADDSEDEFEIKKSTVIDSKPSKLPQYSELPESLYKSDKPKSPADSKTSPAKPADDSEDEFEIKKPTAIDSKPSKLPQFSELPESLDKSDKPKSPVDSKTSPAKPADDSEDEFEIKKPTDIDSKPSIPPQFSDLPKSLDKSDKPKSPVNSKMSPIKPTSFDDSEDEIESEDVFELRQPTAIDAKPSMLPQFSELLKSLDKSDKPKSPVDSKTSLIKLTSADDSEDEFELKKPTATDSMHSTLPQFSELPESLDKSGKPKSPVDSKTSPVKPADDSEDEIEIEKPKAIDSKPSMLPQFSELPESLDKSDKLKSPVDSETSPAKPADDSEDEFEVRKPTAIDSLDKSDKPKSPVYSKTSPAKPADDSEDEFEIKKSTVIDSKPSKLPQYSELPESLDKSDKPKSHVDSKTSPAKPAGDSEDEFEIMKPTAIDSKPSMLPQFSELPESLDKSDKPKSPVDSKTSPADDSEDEIEIEKPTAIDSKPSMLPQFSKLPESLDKSDKPKSPVDLKTSPAKPADDSEDEFEIKKPTAIDSEPSIPPQYSDLPESLDKSDKPISPVYSKTSPAKPADDSEDEFEIKKPTVIDSKPSKLLQYSELPESLDKSDKPKSHVDSKTSPAKPAGDSEDEFEIMKPTAIDSKPSMLPQFSELPESLDKSDKPKSPVDSKTSPAKPADDSEDKIENEKPTAIDSKPSMLPQFSELPESLDKSDKLKSPVDSRTSPAKPADYSEDEFEIKKPTAIDSKPSMLPQFSELPESLDKSDKPISPVYSKTSPAKPADDSEDEFEIKKPTAIGSKPSMPPQFSDLPKSLDKSDKPKSPVNSKMSPIKPTSFDDSEDEIESEDVFELRQPTAIDAKPSMLPQFSELPESLDKSDKAKSPVDSKTSLIKLTSADDSEDEFELKKPTATDSMHSMLPQFSELPESLDKSDKPKSPVDSKTSPIKPISVDDTKDEIELKKPTAIDSKPSIPPQYSDLPEYLDKSDEPKSPVDSKSSPNKPTSEDDTKDEIELKKPTVSDSKPLMPPQFSDLPESLDKSDKPKSPVDSKISPIKPKTADDSEDKFDQKKPTAIDSKPSMLPQFSEIPESLDKSDKPKSPVDSKTSPAKPADDSEDEIEIEKPTAIDSKPSMLPQFSELPESLDKSDKPKSPVDSKTSPAKPADDSEDEFEIKKPTAINSKPSMLPQFSKLPESLDKSDKPKSHVNSKTSPTKPSDDSEDEFEIMKPTAMDSKPSMLPQFSELPESLDKSDKPKSPVNSKTSPIKPISVDDTEDEIELKKPTAIDSKPSIPPQYSDLPESLDKSDEPKSPVDSKTSPNKLTSVDDTKDEIELKKPTVSDSKPLMPSQFSDLPESLDKSDKPKSPVDSKISPIKPTSADDSEDKFDQKKPTAIDSKPSMLPQFSELPESLDKSDKPKSPVDSKTSSAKPADDSEDEIEIEKPTAIDSKPSMLPQFSELPESLDKSDKPKSPVDSKTSPIKPISVDDTKDEIELKKPTAMDSEPSIPPQYSDLPESLDKSDEPKSPVDSKTTPNKLTSVDDTKYEIELKKPAVSDSKPLMLPQFSDLPESLDKSDKPKSPVDSKISPIKPISADDSEDKFDQKKPTDIDSKPSMLPQFSELPQSLDKSDKPKTSSAKPADDSEDEIEIEKPTAIDSKPSMLPQFSELPESLDKSDKPKSPVDLKTSPAKPADDSEDEFEIKKPTAIDSEPSIPPQYSDLPESLDKSDEPKSPVGSKTSPNKLTSVDDTKYEIELKKPAVSDSKPLMLPQFSDLPESLDKSDKPKSPVDSKISPIKPISADDSEDKFDQKKPTAIDSKPSKLPQFSELPESLDKSDKPQSPVDSKTSPAKPSDDSEDEFEKKKPTAIDSKPSMPPQFSDLPKSLDKSDKPKSPVNSKMSPIKPTSFDDSEDEIESENVFELRQPTAIDAKPSTLPQFSELPESLDKSDKPKSPVDSKTSLIKLTSADDSADEFELKKPTATDSTHSMLPQFSELPESQNKSDKPKSPVDSKTSPIKPISVDDTEDEIELKKPTAIDSKPSIPPQYSDLPESLDKSDEPKSPVDSKTSPNKLTSVDDTKDEIELKKPTVSDSKPLMPSQFSDLPESLDKSDKPKSPVDSKISPIKPTSADDSEDKFDQKKPTAIDSKPSMLPQFSELPESLDKSDKPKSPVDSKTSSAKPADDSEDEIEIEKPTAIDSKPSMLPQFSELPESLDKSDKPKSPVYSKTSPAKPADVSEDEFEIKKPTAIDSKPSKLPQFSELPESLDKSDKPKSPVDSKTSPAKPADDSEDEFEIKKPTAIDSKPSMPPQFSDLPKSLDKSDKPKSPVNSKMSPIKPTSFDDSEDEIESEDVFELRQPTAADAKPSMLPQFSELPESLDKSDKALSPVDSKTSLIKLPSADDSEDEFELKKPTATDSMHLTLPQFSELPKSLDKSDKPKSPVDSKTSPIKPISADDNKDEIELKKPTAIDSKPSMPPQYSELPESLDKSDKPKSPVDSKTSPAKPADDSEDEIEIEKPTAIDSKPSMLPQFSELPESLDKSDKPKSPVDSKTSPAKPEDDSEDEFKIKKPTAIDSKPSMLPQFSELPESPDKSDKLKSPVDSRTSPAKPANYSEDEFEIKKPTAIDSKPSMLPQFSELPESLDKSDKPKSPVDSKTSPAKPADDSEDEFEIKKPTAIDSKPSMLPQFSELPESLDKSDKPNSPVDSKTSPFKPISVDDTKYEIELMKPTAIDSKPSMLPQFSELPESLDKSDKPKSPVDSKTSPAKPADDSEDQFEIKKPTAIDSKPSMPPQFAELPESLDKSDKPNSPVVSKTSPIKPISVDDAKYEIEFMKPTAIDSKPSMLPQFSELPESLDKSDKPKSPVDLKTSPAKPADDSEDEYEIRKPTAIDSKPSIRPQFSDLPESLDKSDKPKSPADSKTSLIRPTSLGDSEVEIELKKPTAIDSKPSITTQFSELQESLDKSDKPKSPTDSKTSAVKPTSADDSEDEFVLKKPAAFDSKPSMPPQFSDLPGSLEKSEKPKSLVDSQKSSVEPTSFDDSEDKFELKNPTAIDSKPSMPPQLSDLPQSLDKSDKPKSSLELSTTSVENIPKSPPDSNKSLGLPILTDVADKPKPPVFKENLTIRPYSDDETEDEVDGNLPVWRSPEQSLDNFISVLSRIASESDKSNGSKSISPSSIKPYSDDDSEDEICVEVRTRYSPKNRLSPLMSTSISSANALPRSDVLKSPLKPYSDDESEDEVLLNKSNSSSPIYRKNYLMDAKYISQKPTSPTIAPKSPLKPYSDDESGDEMESESIIKYSDRKSINDVMTSSAMKSTENDSLVYSTSPLDICKPSYDTPKLQQKPYSGDVYIDDLENLNSLTSLSPKHPKYISEETHKDSDTSQIIIKDTEHISSPTLSNAVDTVFESEKLSNTDKTKTRAVAYFVDLDEGDKSKSHHSRPNIHQKQDYDKKLKISKPKLDTKSSVKPREIPLTSKKTYSKRTTISETSPKIQKSTTQTSIREMKTTQRLSKRNNMESSVTNLKPRKDIKKTVVNDYERIISDKTKISALNNQIRLERTLSPQTNPSFSENVQSRSRSTTPRPRIRTDITRVPQQQTLRTFSPPANRPKPDYSSITSTYAYTRKTQKTTKSVVRKQTDHSPSSRSSTPNDDSQRRRLRTPTVPIGEHHYMQPTIAHSRRYGNLKSADSELSLDEKFSKSPVPQIAATTNKNTFQSKQTKPQSGTRKMQTNKINSNSRESLRSIETKTKISIERTKSTADTKQKSTTKRARNLYIKDNSLKSTIDKSDSLTKSAIIEQVSNVRYNRQISKEKAVDKKKITSKSTTKREDSKLSSEDTNRLKDRDGSTTNQKRITNASSKVPIRTKTNRVPDEKVNKLELKAKVDQKQSTVKRNTTKKLDTTKDKLVQSKNIDLKVQKKLKNTLNNQAGSTPKSSPTMSHSSYSSRKSTSTSATTTTTSKNSQSTNKIEKELLNSKLAEKKSFTTTVTSSGTNRISTVKLHREPIATTLVSTVVITDDNDSENNTRSVRSNDSTKSSSSSGSRKVITSEVFTKTFGPDKPFEVIYRQPEVDYMSIMRPQSVEQRCVNEYDVSFIDTTDSSLSDSVALPTFTSDQDRLCAASPGSPKPTRSPFALIEETIRKQQASGFALDPTLQRQFEAVGMIGSESESPMTTSIVNDNDLQKQETLQTYIPEPQPIVSVEAIATQETKSTDITPVPPSAITTTSSQLSHDNADADLGALIGDVPKPKPRSVRISTPTEDDEEEKMSSQMPYEAEEQEVSFDLSDDVDISVVPVPKPRSQMKTSDSFKNLDTLNQQQLQQHHQPSQSDSISLRSFDYTEETSRTDDPSVSVSISMKSQQLDYPLTTTTTTTTTTSEDPATESIDPPSELSIDDGNVETERKTSFYIGESSRNIITKTTPTKLSVSEGAADEPLTAVMCREPIEATDISLMKEFSVDSDEENDVFKEYVTIKPTEPEAGTRIRRQSSETRNDLLEEDALTKETIESTTVVTTMTTTTSAGAVVEDGTLRKTSTEQSFTTTTITSTTSTSSAPLEVIHSTGEDDSVREISESMDIEVERPIDLDLPLEKSEWETTEKEIPPTGTGKIVHSPQQPILSNLTKEALTEEMVAKTLEEVQESLDAAKNELKSVLKDGKSIKESPSEFEFRSFSQTIASGSSEAEKISDMGIKTEKIIEENVELMEDDDISSFIGVPENIQDKHNQETENIITSTVIESLNREAAMLHYAQNIFEEKKPETSLGFVSTGTAESQDSHTSSDDHVVKEERASLGFISSETAEDFSSMENYYQEKLAKADIVTEAKEEKEEVITSTTAGVDTFGEISSELTMKPFEDVVHRIKTESADNAQNRWSVPEIDQSSSSESYYKSFEKSESRPLSSDIENLMTQANSSEYQTAADVSSVYRETTEFVSAVSTFESSSGKTISSHESMRSLDSQSETSANLGSIDVSELSETLVASSTEEAEEIQRLRDLADEEDSDDSLDLETMDYTVSESKIQQQSQMKRSQEMIFKPKSDEVSRKSEEEFEDQEKCIQTVQIEEYAKPKEIEKTWGLTYPMEDTKPDDLKDTDDILLYHGDIRRSIDDSKYASSLDEGSILSVSMSSTSNIDTVVENFEDIVGSVGASSLAGIEGFAASSLPEETTFVMEMDDGSGDLSPQNSTATTPPGETPTKRGHKRSESTSVSGDDIKSIPDKDTPAPQGEGKESESESDTDPYETEYARQFRSPSDRKSKKKKQAAAEMDHSFETEKRPFTPSQLVAEVIVEDSLTEELEAEECLLEERRPSQNMLNYSNIPDIMVTEDIQPKSPILEEDTFEEKTLYKVKTQEELHKATDDRPLHEEKEMVIDLKEENFQKLVQEQYKQKLAELQKAEIGDSDYDYNKAPDSPDSFEMVDQPDISDEFVIIEEVAKEANEDDLGGKSIRIAPTKYESKHDEEVEKIIIKSAPADPKLGSQIFRDDLNFEFEESPPTGSSGGAGSEVQDESDSGPDMAANNKRWVEMQLTDNQLRYPYDLTGGVLEDIKEEDGEFEVGSSRISSFKDSFSSTPEYDVMAARRYYAARGEHDDISMSSLQEFESLEQAISLENRNRTHQGSTDSSNGSFQRRYILRNSASGPAQGDDISISSLKEFEGLENACIEAHLIEIKAKEEAAMLSRSDESNKSNGSDRDQILDSTKVVVSKVTRTVTHTEVLQSGQQPPDIETLLKQKLQECERAQSSIQISEISKTKADSDKGSIDSLEMNRSVDMVTSSVDDSFDISKDGTTKSDIDSLEVDKRQPTREESIESIEMEHMDDVMSKFGVTLGDGLTTTTTTTTTSTDADGHEHTTVTTRIITKTTLTGGGASSTSLDASAPEMMTKDFSAESLNQMSALDQTTTSSAGTTATYQTSAGNSQMSGSITSCASSTLMEDSAMSMSGLTMSSSYWSHEEETVKEGTDVKTKDALNKEDHPPH